MAQEKYLGETGLRRLSELIKEDLSGKANLDGSYDSLQAGSAKQLVSPTGVTDTAPYIFRTTAGSANVSDGLAELKSIRGRTIVWNQLVKTEQKNFTIATTNNALVNILKNISIPSSHKVLLLWNQNNSMESNVRNTPAFKVGGSFVYTNKNENQNLSKGSYGSILTLTGELTEVWFWLNTPSVETTLDDFRFHDLTTIYGAGHEPTSVQQFIRDYPKTFYGYDAGTIKNVQLDGGLKTVGYNALTTNRVKGTQSGGDNTNKRTFSEGEYYVGLSPNNYYEERKVTSYSVSDNRVVCKSKMLYGASFPIRVIGGQKYTIEFTGSGGYTGQAVGWYDADGNYLGFNYVYENEKTLTAPANAYWGNLVLSSSADDVETTFTDICFHLTHSGSRTGFEPHEEHILHIDTAQYFPDGMNGVGTAYDELTPKQAIKRMGMVDLGTMAWGKISNGKMYTDSIAGVIKQDKNYDGYPNLVCAKYSIDKPSNMASSSLTDKTISVGGNGVTIIVCDSDYTDPTAFKQAMSGVYLYYELKEPEITEIPQTRDINWTIQVSDYGTEEFLVADGHEVPVPHETFYMDNLVDKLRNLPEPSEYQELAAEVHKPKLLSDIVDADGNPRFQYVPLELGVWHTEVNTKNGFAFYSINGHSMRIVCGGTIPSGTTLPTSGKNFINEFKIPKWLADKIFFMDGSSWGDSKRIVPNFVPKGSYVGTEVNPPTEQIMIGHYITLKGRYRSGDDAYLITCLIGNMPLTTTDDLHFRFEWNLIIN